MSHKVFQLQAELFKALAHPRRLEIIHLLRTQTMNVSDIFEMLDLPQANVSQHLQVLREAGVVKTIKDGKQIYYSLTHKNIIKASDDIRKILLDQHQTEEIAQALSRSLSEFVIATDPVCGMHVSPKTASFHHHVQGKDYYFCASSCWKQFTEDTQKFIT